MNASLEPSQLLSLSPQKVDIADIQRELDRRWAHYSQLDGHTVTRACMSNLIIYCDNDAQSREIEAAIPSIVQIYPARVILLAGDGRTAEADIDVFVGGYFFRHDSDWQVSAEQIRVVANSHSQRRLPSVTRSQLIGDLPTSLWWASQQPPPFAGKLFYKLANLADQIIYDSVGWTNPSKGMQAMSRWVAAERSEHVIFNLAWRRLKPWRRLLCEVLDPQVQPGALEQVSHVRIEHGPHALAIALLLLGWLASRLGWRATDGTLIPGVQTSWKFMHHSRRFTVIVTRLDHGTAAPQRLDWQWQDAAGRHHAVFSQLSDERLGILEDCSDVPVRVIAAPELSPGELVSAQMAHRSRDKLFESALEMGNNMTSVLKL